MCEPTTAAIAVMAVASAYAARSQRQAGKAAKKASRRNAVIASTAGVDAADRGEAAAMRHRSRIARFKGRQRAAIGGSGVDVGSGSPLLLQEDAAAQGELEVLTIMNNAHREALGFETRSEDFRFQGELAEFSGNVQATSTILGGASQAFAMSGGGGKSTTKKGPN